jgi:Flp pilus assembly protein TadD
VKQSSQFHPQRRASLPATAFALAILVSGCATMAQKGPLSSADQAPETISAEQARGIIDSRQKSYNQNPANRTNAIAYAAALRSLDRHDEAAAVLERAIMSNPEDGPIARAYGQTLLSLGRTDQAIEVLSRAHTADNPDWRVLSALGVAADKKGRHPDARAHYVAALRIVPNNPDILINLAISHAISGNRAESQRAIVDAEKAAPGHPALAQARLFLEGRR